MKHNRFFINLATLFISISFDYACILCAQQQFTEHVSANTDQKILHKEVEIKPDIAEPEAVPPIKEEPDQKIIKLGSTIDLSKGMKYLGQAYQQCIRYLVDKKNKQGGINGKQVELTILDDGYTPERARKNIEQLLMDNVDIIVCPTGTPTLEAYLDLVKAKKLLVLFPETGATIFHKPSMTNIIHLVESFNTEGYVVTNYMLTKERVRSLAFFYQNDDFGLDFLSGAKRACKEAGIAKDKSLKFSYERNDLNFSDAIRKIKKARVDSIGLFSTIIAAMSFIRQMGPFALKDKKLFGGSLGISEFQQFIKERSIHVVTVNDLPNPQTSDLSISKRFRDEVGKSDGQLTLDIFSFKAYVSVSLLFDMLEKIKDVITKEKIVELFEGLHDYSFGGLKLNFDKQTRQLLHSVWLDMGQPKWKKIDTTKEPEELVEKEIDKIEREVPEIEPEEPIEELEEAPIGIL